MSNDDVEPLAGLSSASACIEIKYLDQYTFNPVYTHQCFEKEYIPGFAPMEADEVVAHDITRKFCIAGTYVYYFYSL
jgi:hypothetical protein